MGSRDEGVPENELPDALLCVFAGHDQRFIVRYVTCFTASKDVCFFAVN